MCEDVDPDESGTGNETTQPEDAPPTRVGQAAQPKWWITFAEMPDGTFAVDFHTDGEKTARFLAHKGAAALESYYAQQAFQASMERAKQTRVLEGMVPGPNPQTIAREILRRRSRS